MINSFKNFENLRYKQDKNTNEIISNNKDNILSTKKHLSSTIFASIFSLLLVEVLIHTNINKYTAKQILLMIIILIIAYIFSLITYNFIYDIANRVLEERQRKGVWLFNNIADIKSDFNNIVCNNIIVIKEYKTLLEHTKDKNMQAFYYCEIIHYLEDTCERIERLIRNNKKQSEFISKTRGIEEFRIENIIKIMIDIDKDLAYRYIDIYEIDNNSLEVNSKRVSVSTYIHRLLEQLKEKEVE